MVVGGFDLMMGQFYLQFPRPTHGIHLSGLGEASGICMFNKDGQRSSSPRNSYNNLAWWVARRKLSLGENNCLRPHRW